ncbi:GHKL domain-containing protein [Spirosoma sp. HMF4905]|uniref:GHKL domain-containing protein n=1 Tax=Spirosoma arboris TaxID=2682092 RepID=A0A7K1S9H2_9BACT|nr:histidine kinase [Spirosoma arboris]MVM30298.1 GHKL domain-containing protein [Spirosoma arboris]
MKKEQNTGINELTETQRHLLICVLAAVPIYFIIATYTKTFIYKDDEEAALIATIFCLTGGYSGRYLAQLWIPPNKRVPNWLLVLVPLIMTGCAFVVAQFANSLRSHPEQLMFVLFLVLPFFFFCVLTGLFVKLIRTRINSQLYEARAQSEQSQSELHLLQSQLSPHFLFNTLNNLYGLSISQPDKTPTLLLKLADLLRYSVYDAKELFVPLTDELAYINNYIEFEKIRIGNRLDLTTSIESGIDPAIKIAPMLLIIFIENAFKHSKNTLDQKIVVDIQVKVWANSILFSVKNSFGPTDNKQETLEKNSGLGLVNVKKRLDLLYPNNHDLTIQENGGFYIVLLQIRVK